MTEDSVPSNGLFAYHDRDGFHTIVLGAIVGTSRAAANPDDDAAGMADLKVLMTNGMGFVIKEKEYIAQFFAAYRKHLTDKHAVLTWSEPIKASIHRVGDMRTAELTGGRADEVAEILAAMGITPNDVKPTDEYCMGWVLAMDPSSRCTAEWDTRWTDGYNTAMADGARKAPIRTLGDTLEAYGWDFATRRQLEHHVKNAAATAAVGFPEHTMYPTPSSYTVLTQVLNRWNAAIASGEVREMTSAAAIIVNRNPDPEFRIEALQVELRSSNAALNLLRSQAKGYRVAVDKLKAQLDKSEAALARVRDTINGHEKRSRKTRKTGKPLPS